MNSASVNRVLIVDDSRTIRSMLRTYTDTDPRLVCVGEASDPDQPRTLMNPLNPDILTLDAELPRRKVWSVSNT